MNKLYRVSNNIKKKYNYTNDNTYLVRYQKKFFDLLSRGHDKYIELFTAFERGVESWFNEALFHNPDTTLTMDSYRNGHTILLSKNEYHMYLNFLEEVVISQLTEPDNNSKLMITTHNGGTYLAYYRNGNYEVPMSNGETRIEDAVVIDWRYY